MNQLVRARIFWYGHVHEGVFNSIIHPHQVPQYHQLTRRLLCPGLTNGLRGKKLILYVLHSLRRFFDCSRVYHLFFSDQDDVDAFRTPLTRGHYDRALASSNVTSSYTYRYATAPIRLSAACRLINSVLTGPRAERRESIDQDGMQRVWTSLAESWEEFEELRQLPITGRAGQAEDTDRFVSGWQVSEDPSG